MTLAEFQKLIADLYLDRDRDRGVDGCFRWLTEEVGELARALRRREAVRSAPSDAHDVASAEANLREELADVLAWLSTIASLTGVDLEHAATAEYGHGCPNCAASPCACPR